MLDTVVQAIGSWSAETILVFLAVAYFTGKIGWSRNYKAQLDDKKDQYEKSIADAEADFDKALKVLEKSIEVNETRWNAEMARTSALYESRLGDLRQVAKDAVEALQLAQENVKEQLAQSNETLELSRLIAPIMIGLKRAVEPPDDQQQLLPGQGR